MIPWAAEYATGQITYVGPQAVKVLGYSQKKLMQVGFWQDHLHPADGKWVGNYCRETAKHRSEYELKYRMLAQDGRVVWFHDIVTVIRDESHQPQRLQGFLIDISEKKDTEDRLRSSEELLQLVLETTSEGFWNWDLTTDHMFLSPQWCRSLGYRLLEITPHHQSWERLIHEDDRPLVKTALKTHFEGESKRFQCEARFLTQWGQWRWSLSRGKVVKWDEYGKPLRMVGSDVDITERKAVEEKLREGHTELELRVVAGSNELSQVNKDLQEEIQRHKQARKELDLQRESLVWIRQVQSEFIAEGSPHNVFAQLLDASLALTKSQIGFLGEVLQESDGTPYLKGLAMSNIEWDEQGRTLFEELAQGSEFKNLDTLFGAIVATKRAVILNQMPCSSSGGLSKCHRPLRSFLGLPLFHGEELIAVLMVANRPDGYQEGIVDYLSPFLSTSANLVWAYRNNSRRLEAESILRQSEAEYRTLIQDVLDTSRVGVFILSANFQVIWVNQSMLNHIGLSRNQVIGKDKRQLIHDHIKWLFEDPEEFETRVTATYDNNTYVENFLCHVPEKDGRPERWLEHWSQPIQTGLYAGGRIEQYTDVTDHFRVEELLRNSVDEKELLLKELYHRVKNNLQLVSSMLRLEAETKELVGAQELFQGSQNRIQAMALLHEQLYQSKDLSLVDSKTYVSKLLEHLREAYKHEGGVNQIKTNLAHVAMNLDTAIPVGLIINELVSNGLTHAYTDGRQGAIYVELKSEPVSSPGEGEMSGHPTEEELVLTIRDEGVGIPQAKQNPQEGSLGLRLVSLLARQLKGRLAIENHRGTAVTIRFSVKHHL